MDDETTLRSCFQIIVMFTDIISKSKRYNEARNEELYVGVPKNIPTTLTLQTLKVIKMKSREKGGDATCRTVLLIGNGNRF